MPRGLRSPVIVLQVMRFSVSATSAGASPEQPRGHDCSDRCDDDESHNDHSELFRFQKSHDTRSIHARQYRLRAKPQQPGNRERRKEASRADRQRAAGQDERCQWKGGRQERRNRHGHGAAVPYPPAQRVESPRGHEALEPDSPASRPNQNVIAAPARDPAVASNGYIQRGSRCGRPER